MSDAQIKQEIAKYNPKYICVTGGEPLAQKDCRRLLVDLLDHGYTVSLETSGAISIEDVDPRVMRVVDLKTPASGEQDKNLMSNLDYMTASDEFKFVICNREDYEWARQMLDEHRLSEKSAVLFSPAEGSIQPGDLADWILQDNLPVRMQLQLHKILWGG